MEALTQLTLGLSLRDEATFSNFYPEGNEALTAHLHAFSALQGEPFIYLWGAQGSGRTHLLQACCHEASPHGSLYLDLAERGLRPPVLIDMEYFSLISLDNIEAIMAQPGWEEALFHFFNRVRDQNTRLLVAGLSPPNQLSIQLADLSSRLSGGLTLHLQSLTDEQKLQALQMRAQHRGLTLSAEAANFLLRHYSRKMNDLVNILHILDQQAMAAHRRLTIPFIKQIL
jgi:DnaA-homolog protein